LHNAKLAIPAIRHIGGWKQNPLTFMAMRWLISLFLAFLFAGTVHCQQPNRPAKGELQVTVYKLADGDSFEGRAGNETIRIRLFGIDAPEKGQDFYRKSKDRLGALCAQGPVRVIPRNRDGFGRTVADVYAASGTHINAILVAEGLAWHFTKYSNSAELAGLEREARAKGIGIWSMQNPVAPWDYRAKRRR
jgi:endonuclease YncB( thermonuclease family)